MTQWVFTTVSLANLLWFFLLGSGPVGCLLCCLSNGKTQIWLGDLRLALFLFVGVLVVFLVMICQASCNHRRPCISFLINSFVSCKDRALERDRPNQRKKKKISSNGNQNFVQRQVALARSFIKPERQHFANSLQWQHQS